MLPNCIQFMWLHQQLRSSHSDINTCNSQVHSGRQDSNLYCSILLGHLDFRNFSLENPQESFICTITRCFSLDCLCSYWDTAQDPNKTQLAHPGKLPSNNRFTYQNYNKPQAFESQTGSVRPLGSFHYPQDKDPVLIKIIRNFKWCSLFCSNHTWQRWEMPFSRLDISVL